MTMDGVDKKLLSLVLIKIQDCLSESLDCLNFKSATFDLDCHVCPHLLHTQSNRAFLISRKTLTLVVSSVEALKRMIRSRKSFLHFEQYKVVIKFLIL